MDKVRRWFWKLISNHHFNREKYQESRNGEEVGEFSHSKSICRILCDFEFKIRKRKPEKYYLSQHINKVDKDEAKSILKFVEENPIEFNKFEEYKRKYKIESRHIIRYNIEKSKIQNISDTIEKIATELTPFFTFKEFEKRFYSENKELDFNNFIRYGYTNKRGESIELILQNTNLKTRNNEMLFSRISTHLL